MEVAVSLVAMVDSLAEANQEAAMEVLVEDHK